MFLDERNSLKNQIAKYDRAEEKYIEEGEILPRDLREKRTVSMEQFMKKIHNIAERKMIYKI